MNSREPFPEELADLVANTQAPCLSAYANVHGTDAGPREALICANHLVQRAEAVAVQGGIATDMVRRWLAPLVESIDPVPGQARAGRAFALLADQRGARLWPLPFRIEEDVAISGTDFVLQPLLPVFATYHFYLLSLSRRRARLFGADRYHVQEIEAPGVEAARDLEVPRENLRRSAGGEASVLHDRDQADAADQAETARFLRQVGDWLRRACTVRDRPVILASTPDLAAGFREHARSLTILPRAVHGSPEHCSTHELHARALPVADRHFHTERTRQLARLQECDPQRITADPATVLMAAERGRVQTLALGRGTHLCGRFDGHSLTLDPGAPDLLDRAMVLTLRHGGTILPVAASDLPPGTPCLAHLRY
ncbi:MAG: hypothetical protein R3F56_00960 [Planctomycetota bacterium]